MGMSILKEVRWRACYISLPKSETKALGTLTVPKPIHLFHASSFIASRYQGIPIVGGHRCRGGTGEGICMGRKSNPLGD